PGGFFSSPEFSSQPDPRSLLMTNKNTPASSDAWHARPVDKTSQTDDERIKDITVLPPPEHLIRFFPIGGTPVESLISRTRRRIHNILHGKDDRLLVVI